VPLIASWFNSIQHSGGLGRAARDVYADRKTGPMFPHGGRGFVTHTEVAANL
jgi:hypothetical protein